jgi:superfamily II DNA helicase RecQ
MQLQFFSVPVRGDRGAQEELNAFLRSHRVLTVHREFVAQGDNSFWALSVEYMEGAVPSGPGADDGRGAKPPKVDYKEVLGPADFALFAKLRDWRKATAEGEGVPVYAVLTNEQLAGIAVKRPDTAARLREIEGVGEAKAGKYGSGVLAVVSDTGGTAPAPSEADETHR